MSSLKARNANTWRVEHLQRAYFKNYYEMKRFADEREILCRDHRRSMFLINKEIQALQKTLMDVNLISGYFHEASAAHLRSVSIAFSTCKEFKKARKCGQTGLNVESGNSMKAECTFSQKCDGLDDETCGDCEKELSEVKRHTLNQEMDEKCSTTTYISPHKGLKHNKEASLSHSELSSSEFNEKAEDESSGCLQTTSPKSPADLKSTSLTTTHFSLHRGPKQVHQTQHKVAFHKRPTPGSRKPSHEQDCKTLSKHLQNKDGMNNGGSCVSKTAVRHGLDLLINEYSRTKNADILNNNNKQRDLQEKMMNFVSELSEFKCNE